MLYLGRNERAAADAPAGAPPVPAEEWPKSAAFLRAYMAQRDQFLELHQGTSRRWQEPPGSRRVGGWKRPSDREAAGL